MSTAVLPRVIADRDGNGRPWFAARLLASPQPDVSNVVWRPEPTLTDDRVMRWATDAEVPSDHITLNVRVLAQLLQLSEMDFSDLNLDQVLAAIKFSLTRCRCNLTRCTAEIADVMYDCSTAANERWQRNLELAAQLLGD